jgi:hypothetical protein
MKRIIWGVVVAGVMVIGLAGCEEKKPAEVKKPAAGAAHGHEHKARHGGTLVEIGEEFAHVEVVLDSETGKLTAYVLDGEVEKSERLKQGTLTVKVNGKPVELAGVANELTGEKAGDTSEFSAESPMLKGVKAFDGVIVEIAVRGKAFKDVSFKFPQGNDDHAGHGH